MENDFIENLKNKLIEGGFGEEANKLLDISRAGSTGTENVVNVGNFINELINKSPEINVLISSDVALFNQHARSQGIDF